MTLKELKAELKKKTDKNPDKYYPTSTLKDLGFHREKCENCGTYFWTTLDTKLCGEAECIGGYKFIGDSPTKKKMDFIKTWKEFKKTFKNLGYTPIKRYPVVARWRPDVYWTNASIYDFQPHVVSGEVEPPANPLVVPQACVRFNDIDNVGITGRHYTSFVMIGQHAFETPEKYDPEKYLSDIYVWLNKGMGLKKDEIKFHEDQWGGGGNLGVSMEFFSRGLEIGNQVYMTYQITNSGYKELDLKVLDMGMGQERPAWLSYGTETSYEANFPTVVKKLYKLTGIKPNQDILRNFLPYSGLFDMEETDDIDKLWRKVAKKIGLSAEELKDEILSLSALYSIGDHTRTLLLAVTDGAIPSNVGGCYNLRVILRRVFGFLDKYNWDIDLNDILETHAKYLKPQYPELSEAVEHIQPILEIERKRYQSTADKSKRIIKKVIKEGISEKKLIELYDSQGIPPEMIQKEAEKEGVEIKVPENFYAKVAERHPDTAEKESRGKEYDLKNIEKTDLLYHQDAKLFEFSAKVLKVIDKNKVVLDRTAFYPTSGGQANDTGKINGAEVVNVEKQGGVVIHTIEGNLKEGQEVQGKIDKERRMKITKLHDAAHIIGGAARKVLGPHVWQAGSDIKENKGRLDITHYNSLNQAEIGEIETTANKLIKKSKEIKKEILPKKEAEKKYGFVLYQGGAIPGKELRVIKIPGFDVQACGGTHLDSASEVEGVKILKAERISDGVVRLVFIAGKNLLEKREKKKDKLLSEVEKAVKDYNLKLKKEDMYKASEIFSVQPEQLRNTLERFIKEADEFGSPELPENTDLVKFSRKLFNEWKELKKKKEEKEEKELETKKEEMLEKAEITDGLSVIADKTDDFGLSMRAGMNIISEKPETLIIIYSSKRTACLSGKKTGKNAGEVLKEILNDKQIGGSSNRAVAGKPLKLKKKEILEKVK